MSVVLSEHLPLLASAPDGIQRLRGLILELVVRGKLVPQDPNDEPASQLLKRIAKERAQLEAEGRIKKSKPLPPVGVDDQPFGLPEGWEFSRLGELLLGISSGGTPSKNNPAFWNGDIPWASVKDLGFGEPLTDTQDRITAEGLAAGSFLAVAGSILVCTRMGLGKIGEAMIDVAINQDLKALRLSSEINKSYFVNFFKTLSIKGSGMTVAGIKQDELLEFVVATPPLAEQHRIVAKVDELMDLCDRLEAEVGASDTAHAKLVETLLGTLTQSNDAAELAANWQGLAEHFDTLFTTESSLDALKQTILQLAVMGKLVPQDPNDEPANQLLKRIEKERARLEAEGKIKKSKPSALVGVDEHPYVVPSSWKWVRFGAIAITRLGKMLDGAKNRGELKPYLRNTNVQWFKFELDDVKKLRFAPDELDEFRLADGDLLICEGGEPGRCAIWRMAIEEMYFQKALHRARPIGGTLAEYLQIVLRQDAASGALGAYFTGATIKHFPGDKLAAYTIPLPPVKEQHRIVAKVDELMALCNRLKADLAEARSRQARLSATLIESALQAA